MASEVESILLWLHAVCLHTPLRRRWAFITGVVSSCYGVAARRRVIQPPLASGSSSVELMVIWATSQLAEGTSGEHVRVSDSYGCDDLSWQCGNQDGGSSGPGRRGCMVGGHSEGLACSCKRLGSWPGRQGVCCKLDVLGGS